jgi:hypothetical protein
MFRGLERRQHQRAFTPRFRTLTSVLGQSNTLAALSDSMDSASASAVWPSVDRVGIHTAVQQCLQVASIVSEASAAKKSS